MGYIADKLDTGKVPTPESVTKERKDALAGTFQKRMCEEIEKGLEGG